MKTRLTQVQIAAILILAISVCAQAARLKDIANIEGVCANQLIGYGLVVGLDGTGDSQQTKFTAQTLANMLQEQNITVPADKLKVKNVAAVMVTATLPPFVRPGQTIDVVVSSLGDAKSLQGGTLIQTYLKGIDGKEYATSQGPITVGGFSAGGGGGSVAKNHVTVGRIPGGATVGAAVETGKDDNNTESSSNNIVNILLNRNDFTTASNAAAAIDEVLDGHYAKASNGILISVEVPSEYKDNLVGLIAKIENAEVKTDSVAKVTVNERTGTVIIGGQVRITPCAVAHGSLSVSITTETSVSQPQPLSKGKTVAAKDTTTTVEEEPAHLIEIKGGTSIQELVKALNALKVTPRDLISILQAIKEADALQAQLVII